MARSRPLERTVAIWVLAAAALTVAPLLFRLDPLVTVLAAIPILWQGLRLYRDRLSVPPNRGVLLLLAGAAVAVGYSRYGSIFGKTPGLALLAMLIGLKLVESRSQRDAHVAVQLCFFLQLGYFLIEQSALTGVLAFATCGLALAALQRIEQPTLALAPALRSSLRLLVVALPLAILLFVLFPRIDRPLWGMPRDAFAGTTGLSDSMSPGSIANLSLSGEIAFRADFDGPVPPQRDRYFRGPVLSDFDGRVWRPGSGWHGGIMPKHLPTPNVRYTLTLEPHQQRWLLGLETAVPGDQQVLDGDGVLYSRQPIQTRLRTTIEAHVPADPWPQAAGSNLQRNLALPAGYNPRTVALGQKIASENSGPEARLAAAVAFLRAGHFLYTLTPPLLGRDMADDFLFDTKQGFCEHFAASFTILMRAAGVPTRVVTGYQGGDVNPVDGSLVVRQSDAHAWTEVWLPERGWVRVDPTAIASPLRIDSGIASALPSTADLPFLVRTDSAWLRSLRDRVEALSHAWDIWVLGYNLQRQQDLMRRAGLEPSDWQTLVAILVASAALWQLAVWVLPQWRRRPLTRTDRVWRQLLRHLKRRGFEQAASEGAIAFSERVGAVRSDWHAALAALARRYTQLKYGRPADDQARQTNELEHAVREWISRN
jgi:transglutaminase-like putative cysteine protease